jgi:hypothetical protein
VIPIPDRFNASRMSGPAHRGIILLSLILLPIIPMARWVCVSGAQQWSQPGRRRLAGSQNAGDKAQYMSPGVLADADMAHPCRPPRATRPLVTTTGVHVLACFFFLFSLFPSLLRCSSWNLHLSLSLLVWFWFPASAPVPPSGIFNTLTMRPRAWNCASVFRFRAGRRDGRDPK